MQHDEFIGQVQARAELPGRAEAERAVRATLETLGERIPEGLADNVAAQLPHEIGEHLRRTVVVGGLGTGERFGRDEFVARVGERSGAESPQAVYLARVVLEVLSEATTPGMTGKILDALPEGLRPMLTAGSTGPLDN